VTASGRESNDYEARKQAWIDKNLATAPPLSERQKSVIRTAFAGHRADTQAGAA
jgi:hypothetical protein